MTAISVAALWGACSAPTHAPAGGDHRCADAHVQRTRVPGLLDEGKLDLAVRVIDRADDLCPSTANETWGLRVSTLVELGRDDEAKQVIAAIEREPNVGAEVVRAVEAARAAMATGPPPPDAAAARSLLEQGDAKEAAGEHTQAIASYLRARDLARPNPEALYRAGRAARAAGQPATAQRLFDRAIVDLEIAAAKEEGATGERVRLDLRNGLTDHVHGIAWDPIGRYVVILEGSVISILDSGTLEERVRVAVGRDPRFVEVSPDGGTLAVATVEQIELRNAISGRLMVTIPEKLCDGIWFGSDGVSLFAHWSDDSRGTLGDTLHWSLRDGKQLTPEPGHKHEPYLEDHVVETPWNLRNLGGGRIALVDTKSQRTIRTLQGRDPSLARIDRSGEVLAAVEHDTLIVSDRNGQRSFAPHRDDVIDDISFAPDRDVLLVAGSSGTLTLLDVEGKILLERRPHSSNVRSVGFTVDGGELLTGSGDGTARRWDARSGRVTHSIETGSGQVIGWSPDGTLLAGGCGPGSRDAQADPRKDGGEHICIWDGANGARRDVLPDFRSASKIASEVGWAWSGDGALLAVASNEGLRLWDVHARTLRRTLRTFADGPYYRPSAALAFAPLGQVAEAEDTETGVTLWDVNSFAPVLTLAAPPGDRYQPMYANSIGVDFAGRHIAVGRQEEIDVFRPGAAPSPLMRLRAPTRGAATIALSFEPGGGLLAAARLSGMVEVWGIAREQLAFSLDDGMDQPVALAFNPKGDVLAVGYRNGRGASYSDLTDRTYPTGAVRLWSMKDGRLIATLRAVDGTKDSYVMTEGPDARIEFLGDSGRRFARCHAGHLTLPFEACAERFEVKGLLEKSLCGDRTYLDP